MASDPDQIRDAIEVGIQRLGASLDEQVRSLVDELWQAAQRERDEAVAAAVAKAAARPDIPPEVDAELAQLRGQLAAIRPELARTRDQLATALTAAVPDPAQSTSVEEASLRLVASVRRLDAAHSLTDVLDRLAESLRHEASRAVVLVMKSTHAEAWRLSGFGVGPESKQVLCSPETTGVFGRAASLGQTSFERAESDEDAAASGLPFAQLSKGDRALAVPLLVGGRIVAVVYADDAGDALEGDPDAWPSRVEVLARHAGRCLEALTAQRAQRTSTAR